MTIQLYFSIGLLISIVNIIYKFYSGDMLIHALLECWRTESISWKLKSLAGMIIGISIWPFTLLSLILYVFKK